MSQTLMQRCNSLAAQWCEDYALPVDLLGVLPSVPLVRRAKGLLVLLLCPLLAFRSQYDAGRGTLRLPGPCHCFTHLFEGVAGSVVLSDGITAMTQDRE